MIPTRQDAARALRAFVNAAVFLIAMLCAARFLERVLPPAPVPQFSEKLAHFAAHKDEYDTLFIGSSRTFRQILPSIFDPLLIAGGQSARSFNFGLDGMFSPEDAYVAEKIFALRPQRLRRVFIEVSFFNTDFAAQAPETRRALYWHDLHRTALLCRYILPFGKSSKIRDPERWAKAWQHVRLFLVRTLNLGEGTRLADPWRGVPPLGPQWTLGSAHDGAVPYAAETEYAGENREGFDRDMEALLAAKGKIGKFPPAPLQSLCDMIARVRALGAAPVLFIAPVAMTRVNSPAGQVDVPILDFTDPHRWPVLFDPANRYDRGHLNSPGSRIFTRLFAEQVLALPPPSH